MNIFKLSLISFLLLLLGCNNKSSYTYISFTALDGEKTYSVKTLVYDVEGVPIRLINLDSISSNKNKELWVNLYYDVNPKEYAKAIINDTLVYNIKNMKMNNGEIISMTVNNHYLKSDSVLVIPMEIGIVKKNIMKCN